jgi:hypothetical protein
MAVAALLLPRRVQYFPTSLRWRRQEEDRRLLAAVRMAAVRMAAVRMAAVLAAACAGRARAAKNYW